MPNPILPQKFAQPPGSAPISGLRPGDSGGPVTNVYDPDDAGDDIALPWFFDPEAAWLDYRCTVRIITDPGSVLHKPLPQKAAPWDTLGSVNITDPGFGSSTKGVNLNSASDAQDIIQRMSTSTYRFALSGWGLRAGYQIPIPALVKVGDVLAIPTFPQVASNDVVGNLLGGIPLWYGTWELHYIVGSSPKLQAGTPLAAANLAAHIRPDAQLPTAVKVAVAPPDSNSVQAGTTGTVGGRQGDSGGRLGGFFLR